MTVVPWRELTPQAQDAMWNELVELVKASPNPEAGFAVLAHIPYNAIPGALEKMRELTRQRAEANGSPQT